MFHRRSPGPIEDRSDRISFDPRERFIPTLRAYSGFRIPEARGAPSESLGRMGSLEVRFARTAAEVRRAQRLRFRVFFEEGPATPDTATRLARRDMDRFDGVCDHLLVLDHAHNARRALRADPAVVGTYRMLRKSIAERHGGFYSAHEFDLCELERRHRHLEFLELGRSCVLAPYRTKRTVELLWKGIYAHVLASGVGVMIGCASLEGADPDRLAMPLSFLHHFARAPEEWRAAAAAHRYVRMDRIPKERIEPKAALRELPPLLKGYLRLGAFVGDGAVIDRQFGTTDVLIVLPVAKLDARYVGHFGPDAERRAA